jgi:tetratricopeptide (TPR) repeat protein
LKIRQRLGAKHPDTAETLNNLVGLFHCQGHFDDAWRYYDRALAIREEVLGPEHPETAESLSCLAHLLNDTDHVDEAEPLFQMAITIANTALGPRNLNMQRYKSQYARLLLKTGRHSEALVFAQAALATYEATCGSEHRWTKDFSRASGESACAAPIREGSPFQAPSRWPSADFVDSGRAILTVEVGQLGFREFLCASSEA